MTQMPAFFIGQTCPPVTVGASGGRSAYTLRDIDVSGQHWIRVSLSSANAADQPVPREEWQRFHAPDGFRLAVAQIVQRGTTVVVTSDSLVSGAVATPVTVIDAVRRGR